MKRILASREYSPIIDEAIAEIIEIADHVATEDDEDSQNIANYLRQVVLDIRGYLGE